MKRIAATCIGVALWMAFTGHAETVGLQWNAVKGDKTVHLIGSVHALSTNLYPLPASMDRAAGEADVIAFETDLKQADTPAMRSMMMEKASYPDNERLSATLPKPLLRRLQSYLIDAGIPYAPLQRFRPWYVAMMISVHALEAMGIHPRHGVDMYMLGRAKENNTPTAFFETAEEQFSLLASLSDEQAAAFLEKSLEDIDDLEAMVNRMMSLWRDGDADGLDAFVRESFAPYPAIHALWIPERNRAWMEDIRHLLEQHDTILVVVGAAHTTGREGLAALLAGDGFTVNQVGIEQEAPP